MIPKGLNSLNSPLLRSRVLRGCGGCHSLGCADSLGCASLEAAVRVVAHVQLGVWIGGEHGGPADEGEGDRREAKAARVVLLLCGSCEGEGGAVWLEGTTRGCSLVAEVAWLVVSV